VYQENSTLFAKVKGGKIAYININRNTVIESEFEGVVWLLRRIEFLRWLGNIGIGIKITTPLQVWALDKY